MTRTPTPESIADEPVSGEAMAAAVELEILLALGQFQTIRYARIVDKYLRAYGDSCRREMREEVSRLADWQVELCKAQHDDAGAASARTLKKAIRSLPDKPGGGT